MPIYLDRDNAEQPPLTSLFMNHFLLVQDADLRVKMSETKTLLVEGDAWITCPKCQSEFEQEVSIEVDPNANDVKKKGLPLK